MSALGLNSARALAELFTALIPPIPRFEDESGNRVNGTNILSAKTICQACEEVKPAGQESEAVYSRGFRIFRFERMLRPPRRQVRGNVSDI